LEEALGICPSIMFSSFKPQRLEGESVYQYKWRRKLMNDRIKNRGVIIFDSASKNRLSKETKGRTFRKQDYSQEDLQNAHLTAVLKLKGIDPKTFKEVK
jgi:hypothetical protein